MAWKGDLWDILRHHHDSHPVEMPKMDRWMKKKWMDKFIYYYFSKQRPLSVTLYLILNFLFIWAEMIRIRIDSLLSVHLKIKQNFPMYRNFCESGTKCNHWQCWTNAFQFTIVFVSFKTQELFSQHYLFIYMYIGFVLPHYFKWKWKCPLPVEKKYLTMLQLRESRDNIL